MRTDLGIVGVGLIGASIGMRARAQGLRVIGFDTSARHLEEAIRSGAIDAACEDERAVADGCETLILATPLEETLRLLGVFTDGRMRASLVMDVASVKACVVEAARALPHFVATHPLAGSQRSGPAAAHADLFIRRSWAYVPIASASLQARVVAFIERMGAHPILVDAEEHDRIIAATSHLPQMLSVMLASYLGDALRRETTCALSGPGLRSMTRLGASSWSMWRGILHYNSRNVAKEMRASAAILTAIAEEVELRDASSLHERFVAAAAAVRRLDDIDAPCLP
jgi:prephenate dehydrogenase